MAAFRPISIGCAALLLMAWAGGCARPAEPDGASAVAGLAPGLDSPANAARTVLSVLVDQHRARERNDHAAMRRYDAMLPELAAREVILRRVQAALRRPPKKPEKAIREYTGGWSSIIGFYADGLRLDALQVAHDPGDPDSADVLVPAAAGGRTATVRLELVRGADGKWRTARIDFLPATAAPPAASRPASIPAAPGSASGPASATAPATAPAVMPGP